MILLDTHVLLWLVFENDRLGTRTRGFIDAALDGAGVGLSTISFWETSMLVQRGRVEVADVHAFRNDVLALGITETPVTGDIAIAAGSLEGLHGDPADRIVVATAVVRGMTLVTADEAILRWKRTLSRIDARR